MSSLNLLHFLFFNSSSITLAAKRPKNGLTAAIVITPPTTRTLSSLFENAWLLFIVFFVHYLLTNLSYDKFISSIIINQMLDTKEEQNLDNFWKPHSPFE